MFGNKLGVHFQLTIFSASEISSRYKPTTTGTCHTLLLVDHAKTFFKKTLIPPLFFTCTQWKPLQTPAVQKQLCFVQEYPQLKPDDVTKRNPIQSFCSVSFWLNRHKAESCFEWLTEGHDPFSWNHSDSSEQFPSQQSSWAKQS